MQKQNRTRKVGAQTQNSAFANCWINFACINKKNANIITKKSKERLKSEEYVNAETYKYWIVCKDPDSFSEKSLEQSENIEIMQTLELLKSERIF